MGDTEDQLWKSALAQLELRVSRGNFLTWFRNTQIRERTDGVVIVEARSAFEYEWLSKKYQSLILEVLQEIDNAITDVQFTVASQEPHKQQRKRSSRVIAHKTANNDQDQPASERKQPATQTRTRERPVNRGAQESDIPLNPKYTFDTFVVGSSNEIAHAACRGVSGKPGEVYNPLFIYGGVGLGKTHLLQAVGNALLAQNPHFKILYVSSEKFMNEFVDSLRQHTTSAFKKRYRSADVFIIDDVQFLAGKDKTQEELFHTFNSLQGQNKQVILSSDRPPGSISALQERLASRLSAGMIADIKKPDYETRLAILEEKAQEKQIDADSEALAFIAKNVQSNVRELEGALNRVVAHCELHNQRASVEYTQTILHDIVEQPKQKTVNVKQIIETVSTYYSVSGDDICGKCRKKEIVRPRQVAMYLLREENKMSFPSIAEYFGGRDHTTAIHACDKIRKLLDHDNDLAQEINFLRERLYA